MNNSVNLSPNIRMLCVLYFEYTQNCHIVSKTAAAVVVVVVLVMMVLLL
jgi:hypothetical protein